MAPLLCARGLSFSYRDRQALADVSFSLDRGEVLGLVGPNGSGKTTLIRCLDRILDPEGDLRLDGRDLSSMSRTEIARTIAYVPQNGGISSSATVFETILMGRRPHLRWSVSEEDKWKVSEALALLDIGGFASRRVDRLSGGERQRVLIARALAQDARLLLLDEPTSALDMRNQIEVMALLARLAEEHRLAVVAAIHDLNLAARYCHRIMMLKEGRVLGQGAPSSLLTGGMMRAVYGIEAVVKDEMGVPYVVPLRPLENDNLAEIL
ncbi:MULTISPECIES: ABC transporter ATP-binding protein [unclassified Methanoculleus]|jgi:ABC-type cobalamin/Fe3+-siderophores transport system ATPase subunit|uniref:ABC transporter ATP-binding protein n=1 Tax=unclassified Methanoculleus TaxID=2619537 RepID=UPI0025E59DE1|nr:MULTISPECIES: ABC transporter ATP-binding protein [unclassified Methanoculleus]MCK9318735.1 ABC transporter ATP-binding protein [Methanoculleus sp.]MDD2255130.1 ABC transporter ATP-binding protein [Methanoculleus sp.]MDD2788467.1 ABC transporter ATP-binding protein [Methanoculleus sp.]MDD3216845.1 ABC transporter ATP-binding protein [Methanoculleus sp.]MDD4315436.1 ABC transporter ATP-binding protein [Methanoculleus sp.]